MNKNFLKAVWFGGGFFVGLTLISLGHAALMPVNQNTQTRSAAAPGAIVTELKSSSRVSAPDLDQDYSRLNNVEGKYAESWTQQQRLQQATAQAARPTKKSKQ